MPPATDRPLVTFAVIAYNQERFIREAVEGAFAQTYQPLEIILSDDCSPDRTYEIMQEMAAGYDGPHRVAARQNKENLGLIGHINKIIETVSTDIVVVAAGDDISHPLRTSVLVAAFQADTSIMAVLSDVDIIGEASGANVSAPYEAEFITSEAIIYNGGGAGIGASYAYRKPCFLWPGVLPNGIISEDRLLPLRAILLGRVCWVHKPLVRYRRSENGLVGKLRREQKWAIQFGPHIEEVKNHLDLALRQNLISKGKFRKLSILLFLRNKIALMNSRRGSLGDAVVRVTSRVLDRVFLRRFRDKTADALPLEVNSK